MNAKLKSSKFVVNQRFVNDSIEESEKKNESWIIMVAPLQLNENEWHHSRILIRNGKFSPTFTPQKRKEEMCNVYTICVFVIASECYSYGAYKWEN